MTHEQRYINHDPKLGDTIEFEMPEMIAVYRLNHWDQRENGTVMTDDEIREDVLSHDVEALNA